MPDTWDDAHTGDVVLGHDGQTYGVVTISHAHPAGPVITLTRHGATIGPAQPPPGTPITFVDRADMTAEAQAFAVFAGAGLGPQVLGESYQP
jgi:hypothetical protein